MVSESPFGHSDFGFSGVESPPPALICLVLEISEQIVLQNWHLIRVLSFQLRNDDAILVLLDEGRPSNSNGLS